MACRWLLVGVAAMMAAIVASCVWADDHRDSKPRLAASGFLFSHAAACAGLAINMKLLPCAESMNQIKFPKQRNAALVSVWIAFLVFCIMIYYTQIHGLAEMSDSHACVKNGLFSSRAVYIILALIFIPYILVFIPLLQVPTVWCCVGLGLVVAADVGLGVNTWLKCAT